MTPLIRIGTRRSALALAQSGMMQRAVAAAAGVPPEDAATAVPLVQIVTTGDRVQDRRLLEIGGKAMFTKEIEEALLDGRIDLAVHSMKDVAAEQPEGLVIAATPPREDPRDAFISPTFAAFADLPQGARLGTASLRRQAQALALRPDLNIEMLRGNVDTRLRRLAAGEFDAILLAAAGLNRLDLAHAARELLGPDRFLPAPGQGALALQTRAEDAEAWWLQALNDPATGLCVAAERGAMAALEGSCRTAVGAHATLDGDRLVLAVEALTPDGATRWRREGAVAGPTEASARALGEALGREIRLEAGDRLAWT